MNHEPPEFGPGLDLTVGDDDGHQAVFGRDVLAELVKGLREAASRRRTERQWGPAALGCAMWMDDPELLEVLGQMANACVVVTKQVAGHYERGDRQPLRDLAATVGLAQGAYPELAELAPLVDGHPAVVGPFGRLPWDEGVVDGVRELGFRKVGGRLVPIVHAKVMLLGRMGWTDEHPAGGVEDILYFVPEKLWVGSANFTAASRRSLEMGMWVTAPEMLEAARAWLLSLVALSEPLGSGPDDISPELVPVEYDFEAIASFMADVDFGDEP